MVGIFSAGAAGPSPLPPKPWQDAQYASYIPFREEGVVWAAGTCLIVGAPACGVAAAGAVCALILTAQTSKMIATRNTMREDIIAFFPSRSESIHSNINRQSEVVNDARHK